MVGTDLKITSTVSWFGACALQGGKKTCPSVPSVSDAATLLSERETMLSSIRQHLLRAQQRMKVHADKNRSERTFQVGDFVFLRLQPYVQPSLAPRSHHKLAFQYFGPYQIIAKVGTFTYKLLLPASSTINPPRLPCVPVEEGAAIDLSGLLQPAGPRRRAPGARASASTSPPPARLQLGAPTAHQVVRPQRHTCHLGRCCRHQATLSRHGGMPVPKEEGGCQHPTPRRPQGNG